MSRPSLPLVLAVVLSIVTAVAGTMRWFGSEPPASTAPIAIPVPPFPPRVAAGETYERCLAILANDPDGAVGFADTWAASGGGDGAAHCQALALIATGRPAIGAERLEKLAEASLAPAPARAVLLAQAADARHLAGQPERGLSDLAEALALTPADEDLLIRRAGLALALGQWDRAVADLDAALTADPSRVDALAMRASAWRKSGRLERAVADIDRAIGLDPRNAEALLERGIERQALGDAEGARADWEQAKSVDPNSSAADLAEQNLALLEAGPRR